MAEDDFDVSELLPQYFELCRKDLAKLRVAWETKEFKQARVLGHNLKGSGGAYGFPEITEIGAGIEAAAKASDEDGIRTGIERLSQFLEAH